MNYQMNLYLNSQFFFPTLTNILTPKISIEVNGGMEKDKEKVNYIFMMVVFIREILIMIKL
jgi:hypothetical protein